MYYITITYLSSLTISLVADKFMSNEVAEYEIGRRHLANMMGEDPEAFTQEDVDVSVGGWWGKGMEGCDGRGEGYGGFTSGRGGLWGLW